MNGLGRTPHIMDDHAHVSFDLLFTFLGLLKLQQQLIVLKLKIFCRQLVLEERLDVLYARTAVGVRWLMVAYLFEILVKDNTLYLATWYLVALTRLPIV
jgi:hypothetical protein